MASITINGVRIPFEIIRRQRKTLEIQIDSQSGFRVIAPKRLSEKAILAVLEPKKAWIFEKWQEVENAQAYRPVKSYENGEIFSFNDRLVLLKIIHNEKLKRAKAYLAHGELVVETPVNEKNVIRESIVVLYKDYTKREAVYRLEKYTHALGVQYNRIVVKEQKRRWGSCSHLKNLNFNWRCGMMPEAVFEYILVHEVCHLVHLNHSKAYWEIVARLCPNYAESRLWLKQKGASLDI